MIVNMENINPGLNFGSNKIMSTQDIKLSLDGTNVGQYVTHASIELDASKGIPEVQLTLIPNGLPRVVDGKVFISYEGHTFECVKVHKT